MYPWIEKMLIEWELVHCIYVDGVQYIEFDAFVTEVLELAFNAATCTVSSTTVIAAIICVCFTIISTVFSSFRCKRKKVESLSFESE